MARTDILLAIALVTVILPEGECITSPKRRLPTPYWDLNSESDIFDGRLDYIRNIRNYQEPPMPWEDALRHSVYLTLVRDKVDAILKKNGITDRKRYPNKEELDRFEQEIQKDSDVNLWKDIKRAPFKLNGKPKGPVFGDIAILSRGRLVQDEDGYQFIEDENIEECIECHLYSARPNELEAEKMFACRGEGCNNRGLRALWTVRRIRHRNYDTGNPPFRYELMFSISSANQDKKELNYNVPSQTFTIDEDDKLIKKENKKRTGKYLDKKKVQFPEDRPQIYPNSYAESSRPELNIGEIYVDDRLFQTRPPTQTTKIIKDDVLPSSDYNTFNIVSKDPEVEGQPPTITHLHHHFYLNDQGLPMVFDKNYNHDTVLETMQRYNNANSVGPQLFSPPEKPVSSTQSPKFYTQVLDNRDVLEDTTIATEPPVRVVTIGGRRKSRNRSIFTTQIPPTKPFKPSPVDTRSTYSEPDPLYTSAHTEPPEEYVTVTSPMTTTEENREQENFIIHFTTNEDVVTESPVITTASIETTVTTKATTPRKRYKHYSTRKPTTKSQKIKKLDVENTTPNVGTTQILEPTVNATTSERPRRKFVYKNGRRVKLQKKFSELVNAQVPAPDHDANTTAPYETEHEKKPSETPTSSPSTTTQQYDYTTPRKFKNFQSQRNIRRKYLRKPGSWTTRKTSTTTTTTEETPAPVEEEPPEHQDSNESEAVAIVKEIPTARKAPPIPRIEEVERPRYRPQVIVSRKELIVSNDDSDLPTEKIETQLQDVTTQANNFNASEHQIVSRKSANYEEKDDQLETTTVIEEDSITELTTIPEENTTNPTEESETETHTENTPTLTTKSSTRTNDMMTSQTKRSYVTSISLKMGNKTSPYRPIISLYRGRPQPRKEDDLKWMESSTFMTDLLKHFDMDKIKKSKQTKINSDSEVQVMDNITQKIVDHAKKVNVAINT